MRHLQRAGLHVGAPHVERDPDVELVRHGLALHQAELADVVAVVGGVHDVGVVQLARLHQHVVELKGGEAVRARGRAEGTERPGARPFLASGVRGTSLRGLTRL